MNHRSRGNLLKTTMKDRPLDTGGTIRERRTRAKCVCARARDVTESLERWMENPWNLTGSQKKRADTRHNRDDTTASNSTPRRVASSLASRTLAINERLMAQVRRIPIVRAASRTADRNLQGGRRTTPKPPSSLLPPPSTFQSEAESFGNTTRGAFGGASHFRRAVNVLIDCTGGSVTGIAMELQIRFRTITFNRTRAVTAAVDAERAGVSFRRFETCAR